MSPSGTRHNGAPALEEGLDILELLAARRAPMTLSQISRDLDRSAGPLFRMIQVLEGRGYLEGPASHHGYCLTDKAFSLAANRPLSRDLATRAAPYMRALAGDTGQACHLAVATGTQIVVVARHDAPLDAGLRVSVGFRRPIVGSTSGLILYAFQPPEARLIWRTALEPHTPDDAWQAFEAAAETARRQGYARAGSTYTAGITDLSCPVVAEGRVLAALTIPFLANDEAATADDCLEPLRHAARALSCALEQSRGGAPED